MHPSFAMLQYPRLSVCQASLIFTILIEQIFTVSRKLGMRSADSLPNTNFFVNGNTCTVCIITSFYLGWATVLSRHVTSSTDIHKCWELFRIYSLALKFRAAIKKYANLRQTIENVHCIIMLAYYC